LSQFTPNYNDLIRAQSTDGIRTLSSLWTPELRRRGYERDAAGELQLPMYLKRYKAAGGTLEVFVDIFTEILTRRVYDQIRQLTGVVPDLDMFLILTPPTQFSGVQSVESMLLDALVAGARKLPVQPQEHDVRADFYQAAYSLELLLLRRWYRLPATPETGIPAFDDALTSLGDAMEYYAPSQRFVDEILSRAELLEDVRDLLSYDAEEYLRKTLMKVSLDAAVEYEPLAAELSRRYFASLGRRLTPDQVSDIFMSYRTGAQQ